MDIRRNLFILLVTVSLGMGTAVSALAQPRAELGGTLASLLIGIGEGSDVTVFGVPSASFGLVNPGVYASFFLGTNAAIEPQLGLLVASGGGDTSHIVTAAGQFDYFISGTERRSPYAFVSGGITDVSDSRETPKSIGAGMGIRFPAGGRLTFRFDGRYQHFTAGGGNAIAFGFSIGGLFGR